MKRIRKTRWSPKSDFSVEKAFKRARGHSPYKLNKSRRRKC